MILKDILKGIRAYRQMDKSEKRIFNGLPRKHRTVFFRLSSDEQREEYLLYISILKANSQAHIIQSVKDIAKKAGAPSIELYNYLVNEARKEHRLAETQLDNMVSNQSQKDKPEQIINTEIQSVPDLNHIRERLKLLKEHSIMHQQQRALRR